MGFLSFLFGGGKGGKNVANVAKRFELRGRTGQGSMSKVFQAYDRELGRLVCLKLLDKAKTAKFEEKFKKRGLKKPTEGEICVGLNHPNIIQTYEHGVTTGGEPYLVMEWVDGHGLNYHIETKNAALDGKRVEYTSQLADALQYLHDQKFLHRDLCPRNVMITKDGVVKLIDFGLTIPYEPAYCQSGNRTGTADYLPAEVIKGVKTDHRVDLFALGVTAFEIFTGQLPWERSVSSEETFRRHLNTPPRNPKDLKPVLDDVLCRILLKMISREPADRYSSAKTFKESLEKLEIQGY